MRVLQYYGFTVFVSTHCSLERKLFKLIINLAGAGKTKLVTKVVDYFLGDRPESTLAYFYCDHADPERRDPVNILRSFVKQLAISPDDDSISSAVLDRYKRAECKGIYTKLSFEECGTLLESLISPYSHPVLILDALDETDIKYRHELLDFLDNLISNCCNLKILISSRKNSDIEQRLRKRANIDIETDNNGEDIRKYIEAELEKVEKRGGWRMSETLRDDIFNILLSKSNGMSVCAYEIGNLFICILNLTRFQWVVLHISRIQTPAVIPLERDIRAWLEDLPEGLSETYGRIINDIRKLPGSYPQIAARTFKWILYSFDPLDSKALVEFVKRNPANSPGKEAIEHADLTIEHVLDACNNLLVVDDNDICRFCHLSVREYLKRLPKENELFSFDHSSHAELASVTLSILLDRNNELGWQNYTGSSMLELLRDYHNFCFKSTTVIYATVHWHRHADESLKSRDSDKI